MSFSKRLKQLQKEDKIREMREKKKLNELVLKVMAEIEKNKVENEEKLIQKEEKKVEKENSDKLKKEKMLKKEEINKKVETPIIKVQRGKFLLEY